MHKPDQLFVFPVERSSLNPRQRIADNQKILVTWDKQEVKGGADCAVGIIPGEELELS